jgi:hypothetical protein
MQSLKIIITLIVLITLGIIVGSNLIPTMTVTLLNQPTITLPVGLWLAIAIGLGLLSSSIFQFLIYLDRRLLDRKIRQLQSRLKQDEDIFTYTSEPPKVDYRNAARVSPEPPATSAPPAPKKSIFSSYKANFTDTFKSKPVTNRVIDDDDDWDDKESVTNSQLDWDDPAPQPRQQKANSTSDNYATPPDRSYSAPRQTVVRDVEPPRRDEVYDAEFRLIQPPYKQPASELEYFDRAEDYQDDDDEVEDSNFSRSSAASRSENRDSSAKNSENDEDWGFDFDEEDAPSQKSKPQNRKP